MATITSSISGTTSTYVITDIAGNTLTVTAPVAPGEVTFSGGVLADGQAMLADLMNQLYTGLRPTFVNNSYT